MLPAILSAKPAWKKLLRMRLHGEKGSQTVYVDSLGSIIEVAERVESSPGNNLYLTIDKDYQVQAYHLLEEEIAGIILQKLSSSGDDKIDINEVYAAFIKNGIIDLDRMGEKDASELEQSIYAIYESQESSRFDVIRNLLNGTNMNSYNGCSEEEREYIEAH